LVKPELTTLEACHRLALIEGQKENKTRKEEMKIKVSAKVVIAVLAVCLVVSLFFNGYFYYQLSKSAEYQIPTFFSFVWSSEQQKLTEGPLYINMTFERIGDNLSVIIKINDDDYDVIEDQWNVRPDTLIICFDFYGNDSAITVDDTFEAYLLRPDNMSGRGVFIDSELIFHWMAPPLTFYESDFHYCTFKPDEGYVFNCTFPLRGVEGYAMEFRRIRSDVVTLRYIDVNGSVYIPPFHFGVDVN